MADTQLVGKVIASQFKILKKLGAGGMGAVYLAEQMEMDRKVVVKVLHDEVSAQNPVIIERFRREAKAVAQLNHPNIVQVFVFGQADNGQLYLAMEYVEGRDLGAELERGPMAQPRALKILDQVCAALIEAHGAGIVHRDLKPENVMLADRHGNADYVKVLDFGIAKLHDTGDHKSPALTQQGTVFGTPRYMSPEQVRGEPVDARSDLYALGVILYELLCGRHPFEAVTTIDYLMKHIHEPVPLPSVVFGELDIQPRVEQIVLRCLEKDPAQRYQSAAELQRDVRVALHDFSTSTRGFPSGPMSSVGATARRDVETGAAVGHLAARPARPERRGVPPWVWAIGGLVLVGGVVAIILSLGPKTPGGDAGGATSLLGGDDPGGTAVVMHGPSGGGEDPGEGGGEEGDPVTGEGERPRPEELPADEGPAPTTNVPEGTPIDGFPLPSDAASLTSTPQAEMYETAHAPRDVLQFYRAKLHGRYALESVPNGLMVKGEDAPFSFVTLQPQGDRNLLILSRNALAPVKQEGPLPAAYGVDFPAGATLVMRSEQAVVARSRLGLAAVCDFYDKKFGGLEGVMVMKDLEASTAYCTIAATGSDTAWTAIAIVADPMSKGAVMISVAKRM